MPCARVIPLVTSLLLGASALASDEIPLTNWPAPLLWQPAAVASREPDVPGTPAHSRRQALAVSSPALSFVAITPCRQYDSRSGSPLLDNTPRTVTLTGAPCGIPASAQAAAANITVFNITGAGSNGVLKVGVASPPTTAWINFPFTETQRGNAGVVALTEAGAIVLQVNQGAGSVDFTVDVSGYYASPQGLFTHLIGVGTVGLGGSPLTSFTQLGTWTSSRNGTGEYAITFLGLNPGCANPVPSTLVTATEGSFVFSTTVTTYCGSGDTVINISTRSTAGAAANFGFYFSVYGPSPVASALAPAASGPIPTTCTFTVSTGVETCE